MMSYLFATVTLLCVLAAAHAGITTCTGDADCSRYNATCVGTLCTCGPKTVFVEKEQMCMNKSASIGSPCAFDEQCHHFGNNMSCIDGGKGGVCMCDKNYQFADGQCWFKVVLGGKCTNENNCTVTRNPQRVHCVNSTCTCDANFPPVENNTTCGGVTLSSAMALVALLVGASLSLGRQSIA